MMCLRKIFAHTIFLSSLVGKQPRKLDFRKGNSIITYSFYFSRKIHTILGKAMFSFQMSKAHYDHRPTTEIINQEFAK